MVTLLIVDDHQIVRLGLRTLFERVPDFKVVGEADSVENAIAQAVCLQPSVVLMDMRLPDGSGVEACREIRASCPATQVLFLSSYEDEDAMLAAVFAGARGFLLKEIGGESLTQAVRAVASGQSILDPATVKVITERLQSISRSNIPGTASELLSAQEQRVVALVARGKTNKEIAAELNLSDKTVKNYLSNIFHKLHVSRRSQAAAIYARRSTS